VPGAKFVWCPRNSRNSREEFAAAFTVPIGKLRDWEQRRKQPDTPARALLRVIEREPEAVLRALAGSGSGSIS
jgi:putative transcriptional regulator